MAEPVQKWQVENFNSRDLGDRIKRGTEHKLYAKIRTEIETENERREACSIIVVNKKKMKTSGEGGGGEDLSVCSTHRLVVWSAQEVLLSAQKIYRLSSRVSQW